MKSLLPFVGRVPFHTVGPVPSRTTFDNLQSLQTQCWQRKSSCWKKNRKKLCKSSKKLKQMEKSLVSCMMLQMFLFCGISAEHKMLFTLPILLQQHSECLFLTIYHISFVCTILNVQMWHKHKRVIFLVRQFQIWCQNFSHWALHPHAHNFILQITRHHLFVKHHLSRKYGDRPFRLQETMTLPDHWTALQMKQACCFGQGLQLTYIQHE